MRLLPGSMLGEEQALTLDQAAETQIDAKGGTARDAQGHIQVTFPAGALSQATIVQVRPIHTPGKVPFTIGGHPFDILATEVSSQAEIHHFANPIAIQVSYDPAQYPADAGDLALFYFDETLQGWEPIESKVDQVNYILTGYSDHLSTFDFDIQKWESARLPSLSSF